MKEKYEDHLKRRILILIIVSLIAGLLSGCMGNSIEKRKAKAKELLEKEYNESFTVTDYIERKIGEDFFRVTAYADNYPNIIFSASVDVYGKGISDSYGARRICDTISKYVKSKLSYLNRDCYVFSRSLIEEMYVENPSVGIEELKSEMQDRTVDIFVLIPEEANKSIVINESMFADLASEFDYMAGFMRAYLVNDELLNEIQTHLNKNDKLSYELNKELIKLDGYEYYYKNGVLTRAE